MSLFSSTSFNSENWFLFSAFFSFAAAYEIQIQMKGKAASMEKLTVLILRIYSRVRTHNLCPQTS